MRISDWSSDVCSSDLHRDIRLEKARADDDEGERRPEDVDRGIILTADALDRHQTVPDGEQQAAEQHRLALAEIAVGEIAAEDRSEEHTSELQSLMRISYAVFCLKKKITNKTK